MNGNLQTEDDLKDIFWKRSKHKQNENTTRKLTPAFRVCRLPNTTESPNVCGCAGSCVAFILTRHRREGVLTTTHACSTATPPQPSDTSHVCNMCSAVNEQSILI